MSQTRSEQPTGEYDDVIAKALATEGGHLKIGRGGFTLWFARGSRLSGYDCSVVKAAAIAAGLPVIDNRIVAFDTVARLAISGSMIAVGELASPEPNDSLSYALLAVIAEAYRAAGARKAGPAARGSRP